MLIQGQVGSPAQSATPGANPAIRQGQLGDVIVSELHGRFYEQVYRGAVYSTGSTLTALTSTNATVTGLTGTATPIVAVYNPVSSPVNLVLLQASVQLAANNLTSGAAPGALVWVYSNGNNAISTGSQPFNRKTLTTAGSYAKAFNMTVALTGLTNNLAIFEGAQLQNVTGLTYTTLGSTALLPSYGGVQNIDGSIIVPPGSVFGLMNTVSSTTFSASTNLMWEEVPL
jgi:hypothetical protein